MPLILSGLDVGYSRTLALLQGQTGEIQTGWARRGNESEELSDADQEAVALFITQANHVMETILAILICAAFSYYFGYERGVKETEERWSEAVSKAEWHRKYGGS
jgi:hypothetical protein